MGLLTILKVSAGSRRAQTYSKMSTQRARTASSPRRRAPILLPPVAQRQKQKEREVRLLMLGLDNAGKTTVVKKFNGEVHNFHFASTS